MAFEKDIPAAADAIEDINIALTDYIGKPSMAEPARQEIRYTVQVRYSNGETRVRSGDLLPHLTQSQVNQLRAFLESMRTKAEQEILP